MKHLYLLLVFVSIGYCAFGQFNTRQNSQWTFGYHVGLDFNSGSPAFFDAGIWSKEGTATVCDKAGALLFYFDGRSVYNRMHDVTPNGVSIVPFPTVSTTQGALAVQRIGNASQYYLFSIESIESTGQGRLMYSLFDMTLDGGLGDVVSGLSGMPLADSCSEKMIAIPGNSCGIWLVTHRDSADEFRVYRIDTSGISGPVVSLVGSSVVAGLNYKVGVMKCSHDYRSIVTQSFDGTTELFDFDPATGAVSNGRVIGGVGNIGYGAEFSADNTKLYVTEFDHLSFDFGILQYDLSDTAVASIIASKRTIGPCRSNSDLKLAPDNKIYFYGDTMSVAGNTLLGCIEKPDSAGVDCSYNGSSFELPYSMSGYGFPNTFVMMDSTVDCEASHVLQMDNNALQLRISPNPSKDRYAYLETNLSARGFFIVTVGDVTGRMVQSFEWNGVEMVKLRFPSSGTYVIRAISDEDVSVVKVMVE